MKKYRIKKEYYNLVGKELHDKKSTLALWETGYNFTLNILEEVEDRVEIYRQSTNINNGSFLMKGKSEETSRWTEQERQDIEKFLNVFGTWENMLELTSDWEEDIDSIDSFSIWLKEKGYDKQ